MYRQITPLLTDPRPMDPSTPYADVPPYDRVSPFTPAAAYGSNEPPPTVPNPGQSLYPPLMADPKPPAPFIPSNGFAGNTGGTLAMMGGQSSYGRTAPPKITPESIAATIKSDWGGSFHPFD